jgi:large subunit ribosomal protein L29
MRTKARDLRQLSAKELSERAAGMEEELFNLRFQASMGQLSNPLRLRIVRKDAARVKTLLGEKIREEKAAAGGAPVSAPKAAVAVAQKVAAPKDASKDASKAAPKASSKSKAAVKPAAKDAAATSETKKKVTKKATKKTAKETKK